MPFPAVPTPTVNSKWRVDVDLDVANANGNWAQLKGMSNFVPALALTTQDVTDYDTQGWGGDAVTLRKHSSTATLRRNKYAGSFDPAQETLRAAADGGYLVHVRWYERATGGEAYEGYVLIQWDPQGGDAPGLSEVNVTLLGQGARVAITNPYSATVVPVVNGLSPATGAPAGGTNVVITGDGFVGLTGATAVKFGATNASEYTVVSSSKIVAKAPAGTGTVDVTVTTPTGTSGVSAATKYVYA